MNAKSEKKDTQGGQGRRITGCGERLDVLMSELSFYSCSFAVPSWFKCIGNDPYG